MQTIGTFVLKTIVTLWLSVTITFLLLRVLPSNSVRVEYMQAGLPENEIEARLEVLGLNRSVGEQYAVYVVGLMRGDWGVSYNRSERISEMLEQRLPHSFLLMFVTLAFAVPLGVVTGLLRGYGFWLGEVLGRILGLSFYMPIYWTGTLIIFVIAVRMSVPQDAFVLPVAVLVFHVAGGIAKTFEVDVRWFKDADFMRMAKAKGLKQQRLFWRHLFPNACIPLLGLLGLQTGILFGNTVVIETLFARQGMGLLLVDAVLNRDYNVVQAVVLVMTVVYILANRLAMLGVVLIDPRMRL